MILNENFIDFIKLFNTHQVKYVVVGGWVVIFEGYKEQLPTWTLWLKFRKKMQIKFCNASRLFSGSLIGFTKEDLLQEDNVLMIGRPPFRIDILTSISVVSFEEAYQSSRIYTDDDVPIRCIHMNELIRNKKAGGRFKHLADAEKLEKILAKRNKKI